MKTEIDLVIPWVDGSDPAWQEEKSRVTGMLPDGGSVRFRDWDNLHYLFRGIEAFLPFIRKVHFVTWGHLPPWLNTACEKLNVVNHRDFIPEDYLPTFTANAIELNFHRIEGLSEHFIYANDDMFFLRPLSPDFFFKDGVPVDVCIEIPHQFFSGQIDHMIGNDLAVINKHFSKKQTIKQNRRKWYSPKLGAGALKNLYTSPFACFTGFYDPHIPFAYRKSTFEAVWKAEPELLDNTCRFPVRSPEMVNQWLFRYWQFATGNFVPDGADRGCFFSIGRDDAAIADTISHRRYPMICLNDDDPSLDFEQAKQQLQDLFQQILPNKSAFEK